MVPPIDVVRTRIGFSQPEFESSSPQTAWGWTALHYISRSRQSEVYRNQGFEDLTMQLLQDKIEEISRSLEGVIGVYVKDLNSGEEAGKGQDEVFPTASVFKIPVLIELYRQVLEGRVSLETRIDLTHLSKVAGSGVLKELSPGLSPTIRDLAVLMMIVSDNTATDMILSLLGKDSVNQTVRSLGLQKTWIPMSTREILFDLVGMREALTHSPQIETIREKLKRREIDPASKALQDHDNDISTPRETGILLERLANHEILNRDRCEEIIEIMKRCQTNTMIPLYLPMHKIDVAHKTGSLPGIRNDAGIIYIHEKPRRIILSAFTKRLKNELEGERAIAEIARTVYQHYTS
jgi:beta-lactamase class A